MARPEPGDIELNVTIEIRQPHGGYGGGMRLSEQFFVQAASFLEVCEILGRFKELADRLQKGEERKC